MKFIAAVLLVTCSLVQAQVASLDIRVIIPEIMDISKDEHPIIVKPFEPVQQKITIFSNIKQYCIQFKASGFPVWQPKLLSQNATVERRKICTTKIGTSVFVLEHQFGNVAEISWPVTIEIVAP